mmetsp:Transcript_40118/g.63454  ORF Transcript_40118/g.63454 Transcript_40118/m.63454 type:complete len:264 (+) Transcript_40118:1379-2170(+)
MELLFLLFLQILTLTESFLLSECFGKGSIGLFCFERFCSHLRKMKCSLLGQLTSIFCIRNLCFLCLFSSLFHLGSNFSFFFPLDFHGHFMVIFCNSLFFSQKFPGKSLTHIKMNQRILFSLHLNGNSIILSKKRRNSSSYPFPYPTCNILLSLSPFFFYILFHFLSFCSVAIHRMRRSHTHNRYIPTKLFLQRSRYFLLFFFLLFYSLVRVIVPLFKRENKILFITLIIWMSRTERRTERRPRSIQRGHFLLFFWLFLCLFYG